MKIKKMSRFYKVVKHALGSFNIEDGYDKKHEDEIAKLNTKISKSAYLPNIQLGYGFNAAANFSNLTEDDPFMDQIDENKGHSVNMNISIPIFSRNQTRAWRKMAEYEKIGRAHV